MSIKSNISAKEYSVVFTSSGNWIVPAGVTSCLLEACGGGGGGGAGRNNPGSSLTGGGAGGCGSELISMTFSGLTSGASIPVAIGAGGAVQGSHAGNGFDGGDTTFNGVIISKGGAGGPGGLGIAGSSHSYQIRIDHTRGGNGGGGDGSSAFNGETGQFSRKYSGGSGGGAGPGAGGGGGGGGAGAFGSGANANSGSAISTNYGAGGAGGVGGASWGGGGSGAQGYLKITYVG